MGLGGGGALGTDFFFFKPFLRRGVLRLGDLAAFASALVSFSVPYAAHTQHTAHTSREVHTRCGADRTHCMHGADHSEPHTPYTPYTPYVRTVHDTPRVAHAAGQSVRVAATRMEMDANGGGGGGGVGRGRSSGAAGQPVAAAGTGRDRRGSYPAGIASCRRRRRAQLGIGFCS